MVVKQKPGYRYWRGNIVPPLSDKNLSMECILGRHGEGNRVLLEESRHKWERQFIRDVHLRRLFLMWKHRTPAMAARHRVSVDRVRVEMPVYRQRYGDEWLEVAEAAMDRYFEQVRFDLQAGLCVNVSFMEYWTSLPRWIEESRAEPPPGQVYLYSYADSISVDDIRGEGECAVELGQREGQPSWARQILDPARRKAVGLTDEPRT